MSEQLEHPSYTSKSPLAALAPLSRNWPTLGDWDQSVSLADRALYAAKAMGKNAWVAPNATVIGDVHLGADASIWWNATVRGDNDPIVMTQGRSATGEPTGRSSVTSVPTRSSLRAGVPNPGVLPHRGIFIVS